MCGDSDNNSDSGSSESTNSRDNPKTLGPKQRSATHPSMANEPAFEAVSITSIDPNYMNTQNYLPSQVNQYGRPITSYNQPTQTGSEWLDSQVYADVTTSPYSRSHDINRYKQNYYGQDQREAGGRGDAQGSRNANTPPPPPPPGEGGDGGNEKKKQQQLVTQQENARRKAVSARNAAINTKQAAINKAFTDKYTTDYYSGLRTAYNNEYLDDLQSAYDASMRGIWEGIRNTGVFDQTGFDTSKGKLDTAKTAETTRLDDLAKAYRDAQATAVGNVRSGILSDLAGLYSGNDVSASQAAAEQAAVEGYSYLADMETLRETPSMGDTPTFFSGFNQAAARQAAPTPTVRAGRSPQQEQQARGLARTMVRSPVGGGSSTVIRG